MKDTDIQIGAVYSWRGSVSVRVIRRNTQYWSVRDAGRGAVPYNFVRACDLGKARASQLQRYLIEDFQR